MKIKVGLHKQEIRALMTCLSVMDTSKITRRQKIIIDKEGWFFFCAGAILAGLSQIFMFNSLQLGEVVMVIPLHTVAKPFFILLLTSLFLKDSERITYKIR